jgi:hypothetical protein
MPTAAANVAIRLEERGKSCALKYPVRLVVPNAAGGAS